MALLYDSGSSDQTGYRAEADYTCAFCGWPIGKECFEETEI